MHELALKRRAKQSGVFLALWTALALIPGIQVHTYIISLGHSITWGHALLPQLLDHWIWAVLTPGVLWISSRYPIERRAWVRVVGIHLLGSFAFAIMHVGIRFPFLQNPAIYTSPVKHLSWLLFRNSLSANYYDDLWMYSTIVAVSQLWNYYRKFKDRELLTTKLEGQLAQAHLQVLKMQLNPHFLFNTLHAISSLMHEDVEAADNMLTGLSDLLRMSLENVNEQEITLKREMEFLQGYLEIQQIRFRDRMTVKMDIPTESLDALVPNMILQPLVENAVTHGIGSISTAGEIRIRALRNNGVLRLEVSDNGKGLVGEFPEGGLGLTNTRARLLQLYGETQRLAIDHGPDGGTVVTLEIPFHVSSPEESKEIRDGD